MSAPRSPRLSSSLRWWDRKVRKAWRGRTDLPAALDHQAQLGRKDLPAPLDHQAQMGRKDRPVLPDRKGH